MNKKEREELEAYKSIISQEIGALKQEHGDVILAQEERIQALEKQLKDCDFQVELLLPKLQDVAERDKVIQELSAEIDAMRTERIALHTTIVRMKKEQQHLESTEKKVPK